MELQFTKFITYDFIREREKERSLTKLRLNTVPFNHGYFLTAK